MEKVLFVVCCVGVVLIGAAMLACAVALFCSKAKKASIWSMPRFRMTVFSASAIVATLAAQKSAPKLVYRSTLNSAAAITQPIVGEDGTCAGATFVPGRVGKALYVPAHTQAALVPFSNGMPTNSGCIEFWAKLPGDKDLFMERGDPLLISFQDENGMDSIRVEYNMNNGSGGEGLCAVIPGFAIWSGGWSYSSLLSSEKISDWHHYALVWNVDGIASLEESPVVALLLDGRMVAKGTPAENWDKDGFMLAMSRPFTLQLSDGRPIYANSPYSIDELRVWDSDVTTFNYEALDSKIRYVDANAPEGGMGLSWEDAARTIDEVSQDMGNGCVIYVKPGTYAPFHHKVVGDDPICSDPLSVVAVGGVGETIIDGEDEKCVSCDWYSSDGALITAWPARALRIEGFTVRRMTRGVSGCAYERCVVSGFSDGFAGCSTFNNCLITGNSVGNAGALFDYCSFVNCTVAGNNASGSSVAPPNAYQPCTAVNSIFWGNGADDYGAFNATNCCVEAQCQGVGNISVDPKFADASNGDYRLTENSPCIDAGDNSYNEAEIDLAGATRVQNGIIDIGAFESVPSGGLVYCSSLDSEGAITTPHIGEKGTCSGATFVPGRIGKALYVPAHTQAALVPFSNGMPTNSGCIEFWAKLPGDKDLFMERGDPLLISFLDENGMDSIRVEYNRNNGSGGRGLCAVIPGFAIWSGGGSYSSLLSSEKISDWHHYALVWNVDGIVSLEESPVVALLLDGRMVAKGTPAENWDKDGFMSAMSRPFTLQLSDGRPIYANSSYAIDELKVWNSDVITYKDFTRVPDVSVVYDGKQHALAAPDGAALQYSLSESGPFVDECPSVKDAGETAVWYVQTVEGLGTVTNQATITITPRPVTFTSASAEKKYDGTPLTVEKVYDGGGVVGGDKFVFTVTGSQTTIGVSANKFTWAVAEGTVAANYSVTTVFGTLKVTAGEAQNGWEYDIVRGADGEDAIKVRRFGGDVAGDIVLPQSIGGLPVRWVAGRALDGLAVTSVAVPGGMRVDGALFAHNPQITNVTFDAAAGVDGALSFRRSVALKEVVIPAGAGIAPHSFLGCWALERVVFLGEPDFAEDVEEDDPAALLAAAARPASLLQMADMICYPAEHAAKWEKVLRNLGYGGRYGAFDGEWTGVDSLLADSGNMMSPAPTVTPTDQPAAQYALRTGVGGGALLPGAAGWDAFNIPDGMAWDKATGALVGTPVRSGVYDVLLVSGSGASTKIMRTTLEVAGYAVITGYVGVAFSASGLPVSDLKSYSKLPAGLAWKNKVLSGVPTKAGKYTFVTKAGEPVEIRILAVPGGAVGVFNGQMTNAAGRICPVKVTATAAGKVTATMTIGTKAHTLKASRWNAIAQEDFDGVKHRVLTAKLTASKLEMVIKVDADAAWNSDAMTAIGTLGAAKGYAGTAQRDAFSLNDDAKTMVKSLAGTYSLNASSDGAGGWQLVPSAVGKKGALTVKLKATGAATLSGKLTSKTTVSASATVHVDGDGRAELRFYSKGVWIVWRLED